MLFLQPSAYRPVIIHWLEKVRIILKYTKSECKMKVLINSAYIDRIVLSHKLIKMKGQANVLPQFVRSKRTRVTWKCFTAGHTA